MWHTLCSQGIPHPRPASADSTLCSHTSSRKDYQLTSWILSFSQTVVSQSFFNCGKIYIKLTMLIIKIFLSSVFYNGSYKQLTWLSFFRRIIIVNIIPILQMRKQTHREEFSGPSRTTKIGRDTNEVQLSVDTRRTSLTKAVSSTSTSSGYSLSYRVPRSAYVLIPEG